MSGNSSSSTNTSVPSHLIHTSESTFDRVYNCLIAEVGPHIMNAVIIIQILVVLPLCIFILYLIHKQWHQQGSARMSHSDLFTFHLAIMEVINIFSIFSSFCGIHTNLKMMTVLGVCLFPLNFCGQMLFHTMTCVERYVAAVHPVTYLGLRNNNGVRIRNVLLVCVWLLCVATLGWMLMTADHLIIILSYCAVPLALITMSFCSVSVLCTLIHPKPGEGGGDKLKADQSKMRAFSTIMVILGVLIFRFGANTIIGVVGAILKQEGTAKCSVVWSDFFFSLPCSFVLPLLFLQKAGKLKCCKRTTKSSQRSD